MPKEPYAQCRKRLRALREKAQITEEEICTRAGLYFESYYDLETYPEDIGGWYIEDIAILCKALEVPMVALFTDEPMSLSPVTLQSLVNSLEKHLQENKKSIEEFEEECGWYVEQFISYPDSIFYVTCVAWLYDVAMALSIEVPRVVLSFSHFPTREKIYRI